MGIKILWQNRLKRLVNQHSEIMIVFLTLPGILGVYSKIVSSGKH